VEKHGARDATVRGTAMKELAALQVRTSQYNPGHEVPEMNWLYRLAKRFWFNDFGVYRGHDHSRTAAPALVLGAPGAAPVRPPAVDCLAVALASAEELGPDFLTEHHHGTSASSSS